MPERRQCRDCRWWLGDSRRPWDLGRCARWGAPVYGDSTHDCWDSVPGDAALFQGAKEPDDA